MEENKYVDILTKRDIQPTAIRILVLQAMMQANRTVSLLDLENMLDTVDKSSIFRTLTLFLSHSNPCPCPLFLSSHLAHSIDDGTGSLKYAVCGETCSCDVEDLHTHFHCEKCNKTFCLKNIPTPVVTMPKGFTLNSINYVLKGLCPDCAEKLKN